MANLNNAIINIFTKEDGVVKSQTVQKTDTQTAIIKEIKSAMNTENLLNIQIVIRKA